MKPKTRKIPYKEHQALYRKLVQVPGIVNESYESFHMITGDFEPTQNMNETRWILIYNSDTSGSSEYILQVDGVGDAILLEHDHPIF